MFRDATRSVWGRLSAGVAFLAIVVWFLWPTPNWEFEPEPFVAALIAALAWINSIIPEKRPTKHDKELLQKFAEDFDYETREFLKHHDFGASFSRQQIDPLYMVAAVWAGVDYEFDDPKIQKKFSTLLDSVRKLSSLIGANTWFMRGSGEFITTKADDHNVSEVSREFHQRMKEMNDGASRLIKECEEFLRYARGRLHD